MSNSNYTLNSKINQPRKMTHSEAGRRGAEATRKKFAAERIQKIQQYDLNPKLCRQCVGVIPYDRRRYNVFCSHYCRAIFYGSEKSKRLTKQWHCNSCGKAHHSVPHRTKRFCNHKCQSAMKLNNSIEKFKQGQISNRKTIKRCLTKLFGYKCFTCGLDHWHRALFVFGIRSCGWQCRQQSTQQFKIGVSQLSFYHSHLERSQQRIRQSQ